MSKLGQDFGVRALLAILTVIPFELLLFAVVIKLNLTLEVAIALLGIGQAPAMLALGFYFGQRTGQPK